MLDMGHANVNQSCSTANSGASCMRFLQYLIGMIFSLINRDLRSGIAVRCSEFLDWSSSLHKDVLHQRYVDNHSMELSQRQMEDGGKAVLQMFEWFSKVRKASCDPHDSDLSPRDFTVRSPRGPDSSCHLPEPKWLICFGWRGLWGLYVMSNSGSTICQLCNLKQVTSTSSMLR